MSYYDNDQIFMVSRVTCHAVSRQINKSPFDRLRERNFTDYDYDNDYDHDYDYNLHV